MFYFVVNHKVQFLCLLQYRKADSRAKQERTRFRHGCSTPRPTWCWQWWGRWRECVRETKNKRFASRRSYGGSKDVWWFELRVSNIFWIPVSFVFFFSIFSCSGFLISLRCFFFLRNDNVEKSLESYRKAFDIVYLVSHIHLLCLNIWIIWIAWNFLLK